MSSVVKAVILVGLTVGFAVLGGKVWAQPAACETCYEWTDTGNPKLLPLQAQCCVDGVNACFVKEDNAITGSVDQPFCWIVSVPEGSRCVNISCDDGGTGGSGGGGGGACSIGAGDGCPAECPSCTRQAY